METKNKTKKTSKKTAKADEKYIEGIGRRKTAVARVRIIEGSNKKGVIINDKKLEEYFPLKQHQDTVLSPLVKTDAEGKFFISIKVKGGGVSAQADAIRLGLSRALVKQAPNLKKKLRVPGYLTRDARVVERKKYGLKKARRAPQWSKR